MTVYLATKPRYGAMIPAVMLATGGASTRVPVAEIPRTDDTDGRALRGKCLTALVAKVSALRADVSVLETADDVLHAVTPLARAVATGYFMVYTDERRTLFASHAMSTARGLIA
jgi:hypothetical protein